MKTHRISEDATVGRVVGRPNVGTLHLGQANPHGGDFLEVFPEEEFRFWDRLMVWLQVIGFCLGPSCFGGW